MGISEIEKLESRWRENPQGLTFAPLAEAYRKTGELARALDVLRPGLERHPDYIPASIVLGRCHLDLGDLPAAESAFGHVLGLDSENVIALKALADICERQGRHDEAERWLHHLLSIDRSNDEARQQLARIEEARRAAAAAPAAESTTAAAETSASTDTAAPTESEPVAEPAPAIEAVVAEPPPPPLPERPVLADVEPTAAPRSEAPAEPVAYIADVDAPELAGAEPMPLRDLEASRAYDIVVEEPEKFDTEVTPLAGLVGREAAALGDESPVKPLDLEHDPTSFGHLGAEPAAEPEPLRPAPRISGDFQVELPEEIVLESAGVTEYQTPSAAEQLVARAPDPSPFADLVGAPPEPPASTDPLAPRVDDSAPSDPDLVASPSPVQSEPVVVTDASTDEPAGESTSAWAAWSSHDEPAAEPETARVEPEVREPEPVAQAAEAEQVSAAAKPEPVVEPAPVPEEPAPVVAEAAPVEVETSWDERPASDAAIEAPAEPTPAVAETPDVAAPRDEPFIYTEPSPAFRSAVVPDLPAPSLRGPEPAEREPAVARAEEPETAVHASASEPLDIEPKPDLVVTETMAELYRRQGHPSEALKVYRELEQRSPEDERLRQVIASLEEETATAPAASSRPSILARDTGGESVGDFFRALLAARPPAAAASRPVVPVPPAVPPAPVPGASGAAVGGAPTRPASEPISLAAVFGEPSSPVPPAMPQAGGSAPAAAGAGVSFEEFFRAPSKGAPTRARAEAKRDDLDEFHAWLQNLKR